MLTDLRAVTGNSRHFARFIVLVTCSAIAQAAAVLLLFPLLQDLFGPDPASAWPWLLGFLALIACAWGLDILAARSGLELGISVMEAIHRHAPGAISAWPEARFTPERTGKIRALVSSGAHESTSAVVLMIGPVITAFVFTFALGIGLLFIDVTIAIVTLLAGLALIAAMVAGMRMESRAEKRFADATEDLDSRLFEFAWAQPSLRTARRTSAGRALVDDAIDTSRRRAVGLLLWQIPGEIVFSAALQFILLSFAVATWLAVDHGSIAPVGAAALIIVLLRVVEQVTVVSGSTTGVLGINRTLAEARAIIDTTPVEASQPLPSAPDMRAEGLGITYPDGTVGLSGATAGFAPGTVTVVVGRSGSGKSTLLRALSGLADPSAGAITLDGTPADTADLRGNAAVVFQHTSLGAGSVKDAITAVNPSLDDAGLARIAEASQLRRAVESLAAGWDTPVGELGEKLSGGERQRVGIARALAKPASVLLVDEATSALDSRNERAVIDAIAEVRARYTTVIVTHRPATLDIADQVIVMADGRIAEIGTPAELESANGEYTRLVAEWRDSAAWRVG